MTQGSITRNDSMFIQIHRAYTTVLDMRVDITSSAEIPWSHMEMRQTDSVYNSQTVTLGNLLMPGEAPSPISHGSLLLPDGPAWEAWTPLFHMGYTRSRGNAPAGARASQAASPTNRDYPGPTLVKHISKASQGKHIRVKLTSHEGRIEKVTGP